MSATVYIERVGSVGRIVLNRPDAGNTIDEVTAESFANCARDVAVDSAIRLVVLTGSGPLFCGGGDVRAMAAAHDGASAVIDRITSHLHRGILVLAEMQKPLVTVINGPAAGAGLGLAVLGDLVIASETAHFTSAYTAIGMTPDGATSWLLPRLIGLRKALDMVLTNRRVGAEEAERIGLVTRVVPASDLAQAEREVTEKLASGAVAATGRARWLLETSYERSLSDHLAIEARTIVQSASTEEGRQGVENFLSRRK